MTAPTCVQENRPEVRRRSSSATFAELDRAAPPDAMLASARRRRSSPRSFTEELAGRARCIVAHPVNPPHLVPVVELCGAPWTIGATRIARARAMSRVGQVPVDVRREIEGFILNRLQGALLAEAIRLVGEGYVSPQDLDKTVADGLGLRWSFMGPFETIELNAPGGIADYCARYSRLLPPLRGRACAAERVGRAELPSASAGSARRAADRRTERDRRNELARPALAGADGVTSVATKRRDRSIQEQRSRSGQQVPARS